ncbi:MAG TPA: hypothetical protein VNH83_28955 [Bryobacteraceae bacterium]|nr:hypothetical protein [Bryobacteraceae bacterium]
MNGAAAQTLVREAEQALESGVRLKQWFQQLDASGELTDRFGLRRSFNPPGNSYGFFDVAPLGPHGLTVFGVVQEVRFDTLKAGSPLRLRDEMREFVLRYFMRVTDFRRPDAYAGARRCMRQPVERVGFGYSQHFYKLSATGEIGEFPLEVKFEIIDLRELLWRYDWIVVRVDLFDFDLSFQPFGDGTPSLRLPLPESNYLVLSRQFISDDTEAHDGAIGRFGLGYALVKNPLPSRLLAYGPGEFDAGFQTIDFTVLPNGESHVRMIFVVNRPRKILNLPVDPVFTFIDAMNLLTAGAAARLFCVSHRELEIGFMVQHFKQHYDMIVGALSTWSQFSDWLDEDSLPEWVKRGVLA